MTTVGPRAGTTPGPSTPATRRRGSVLILVMTLLGILFITGVAFLASTNFEANLIEVDRRRSQQSVGVDGVSDAMESPLHDGLLAAAGLTPRSKLEEPFGRKGESDASANAIAELPGVHNLFAPVEPYRWEDPEGYQPKGFRFRWFTDSRALADPSSPALRGLEVDTAWPSGVPINDPTFGPVVPVDSDGDGITDTIQFDLAEIGFSKLQIAEMAPLLNAPSNPNGRVFLGMRIIAHGGLVDLNESHPTLVANVLNVSVDDLSSKDFAQFRHRPSLGDPGLHRSYSPLLEEGLLRRRVLLPPRVIPPSLLHGNALLDPASSPSALYGDADLATLLFPPAPTALGVETVFEGQHRYRPFSIDEPFDPTNPNSAPLWAVRMEPTESLAIDPAGGNYDRRHLLTTISYDDLLSRGGRAGVYEPGNPDPVGKADLRSRMIEANRQAWDFGTGSCEPPFEYVDYPQTMPDRGCDCPNDPQCRFDPRKGRLQLSLAWLDEAFPCEALEGSGKLGDARKCRAQRLRLIYDVFMMLVRNARGPYWDDVICSPAACTDPNNCPIQTCPEGYGCGANGWCADLATGEKRRLSLLSRTAASLTANLIDFMDADDIPTRVALRSFDFSNINSVGREFGSAQLAAVPPQYVYGLERQPYITEVATQAGPEPEKTLRGWAVEVFNPYDVDLPSVPGQDEYVLVQVDPDDGSKNEIRLMQAFPAGQFTVFVDESGSFSLSGQQGRISPVSGLQFKNGWILYLVRRVRLPDGGTQPTDIVVDQFRVSGSRIGKEGEDLRPVNTAASQFTYSIERVLLKERQDLPGSRWMGTVPDAVQGAEGAHTLGDWNSRIDTKALSVRPVEVNFASTGRFATAFPTTGTMLLLMRHANRGFEDFFPRARVDLAFTTWLDDEETQIDNGRMPVFDLAGNHHVNPANTPPNTPGGLADLPWGQLVFDYFTALPLVSAGPYANPDNDIDFKPAPDAKPHVDLDGLRVHGRININAAPWTILAGLPLVPADRIPGPFRTVIQNAAGLDAGAAATIGAELAQAIVAYRELRALGGSGDYDTGAAAPGVAAAPRYGRGWGITNPAARRGTGFLSVGELANVRHSGAAADASGFSLWRIDGGEVDQTDGDYVGAVAILVALGDWVTVRSDVFTLYGTLRGEGDPSIPDPVDQAIDVDRRAIRFQETVDRLPAFLGSPTLTRIGERVAAKYVDIRND